MTYRRLPLFVGALLTALLIVTSQLAAQPTLTTIHSFSGGPSDGANPFTGVVIGAGGVLYGNTGYGGTTFHGTAFSLTPPASPGDPWTESVYSLPGGREGNSPITKFATAISSGVLVGSTLDPASGGAVFSLHPPASPGGSWGERLLFAFTDYPSQGQNPNGVTIGSGGVLYGTAQYGGSGPCDSFDPGCGVVFSLTPPATPGSGGWTETVLYNFAGYPSDGGDPTSSLIVGSGGVLYGTTVLGGANNTGTVFSLTPPSNAGGSWTEKVLYSFPPLIGGYGPGALVIGSHGVIYGTTIAGGTSNESTVFSLTPPASPGAAWKEAILNSFSGGATDGAFPNSLAIGRGGVLYGSTASGGPAGNGTLFSLTPPAGPGGAWTESVLHFFGGDSDGYLPEGIVIGSGGMLYGTTHGGGPSTFGTVFSFTP